MLVRSTISHLSYVLIGAALGAWGSTRAVQGASLHILAHGVGKGLLFLVVGSLSYAMGTRSMRGLTGLPPGAARRDRLPHWRADRHGRPAVRRVLEQVLPDKGAVELGGTGVLIGVLLLVESVIAFAWFLWVGQRVFLGEPSAAVQAAAPLPRAMSVSLLVLLLLCLGISLVGVPLAQGIVPGVGK